MATKTLQPLGRRVLVQPQEVEETTTGGLIVPPSANEDKKPASGVVVKLGVLNEVDKKKGFKFTVKEGDTVYFKEYSPEKLDVNGDTFLIIEESEIVAIVK